jgi:hypothetical protein
MGPLVIVLIVVTVLAAACFGRYFDMKRREELAAMAARLGLRFSADKNYGLAGELGFLDKLAQGSNRYAFNVMHGQYQEQAVWAFDYHYETYSTDSRGIRRTHDHLLFTFVLGLPCKFPELRIGREGILSKIAQTMGYDDIDFESHEFSRAFCVRSSDRKFAYDVCNARMMEFLLENRELCVEIENNVLALLFDGKMDVERIPANLDRLVAIRRLMPGYLFDGGAA